MTFSFSNPDVDRVSLSERVRKLEGRFGPGGGGGLGVGMPDFDQYPDNAYSETPEGFVLKVSIDDFANQNVPELAGIGLKFIFLWRMLASYAIVFPVTLCRAYLNKELPGPISRDRSSIQTNISLNNQDILINAWHSGFASNYPLALLTTELFLVGFNNPTGSGTYPQNLYSFCGIRLKNFYKQTLQIDVLKSTNPTGRIYPCYMFGVGGSNNILQNAGAIGLRMQAGSQLGNIPDVSKISVAQLTDLPASALNFFPKSWCQ